AALSATILLPLHRRNPEITDSGSAHRHHRSHGSAAVELGPMARASVGASGIGGNLFPSLDNLAGWRTNRLGGKRGSGQMRYLGSYRIVLAGNPNRCG